MTGTWILSVPGMPQSGSFSGNGGNGEAKLGPPTATPVPPTFTPSPTPPPVGGVSLDARTQSGDAIDARWLIALASSAFALGGAALYTRRRRVR